MIKLKQMLEKKKVNESVNHMKVQQHFDKIIKVIQQSARQLNDDDTYELHEKLKKFFNKSI